MRRTIIPGGLAALAAVLGLALAACDDDGGGGAGIRGTVIDIAGEPAEGAVVSIFYGFEGGPPTGAPARPGTAAAPERIDVPIVPMQFDLRQNAPNPFSPTTRIAFALPQACRARIEIRDRAGDRVRLLTDGERQAGEHSLIWDGRDEMGEPLPNGWYACRLDCRDSGTRQPLYGETVGGLFLDGADVRAVGPLAVTDADGRFFLPFDDLPLGLEVPFVDENGDPVGTRTVGPQIQVQAARGVAVGHEDLTVADGRGSVFVRIGLASPE